MADSSQPTPGEWAILGGGAAALVGSFLDFNFSTSAWGEGALPIATLIPIYVVVVAVVLALQKFASVSLPDQIMGLSWGQINHALTFFASLMALFWLVAADDAGVGLYLMLAGSIAALAGSVMTQRDASAGTDAGPGTIG